MSDSPTMWQKFSNFPRAVQWVLIAAVSFLAYMAYSDYIWTVVDDWNKQADVIEKRIQDAQTTSNQGRGIPMMSSLVRGVGPVEEPQRNIDDARSALKRTINAILKRHSVNDDDLRDNPSIRMPAQTLNELTNGTARVDSLSGILKFEADVDTTMAIISELESSPDIESISDVRLTKISSGAKKLSVRLTVVAWVYSSATRHGGGGLQ